MAKKKEPTGPVRTILEALDKVEKIQPRPADDAAQALKKNYAEQLSRHLATCLASALRKDFQGILPDKDGRGQESKARSRRSLKKLDVNYSTVEMGLGLGGSIKTLNFRDYSRGSEKLGRFSKNYSRNDNELRAEATDYHLRQPYAVLVGILFLPIESCDDGGKGASSFAAAVNYFRLRGGCQSPTDDVELFERFFVGLYHHRGEQRGSAVFFDVIRHLPPKNGRPKEGKGIDFETMVEQIRVAYDERNNPPPRYADECGEA
jgi:hypothetical protein